MFSSHRAIKYIHLWTYYSTKYQIFDKNISIKFYRGTDRKSHIQGVPRNMTVQDDLNYVIVVSRIIHVKVDRILNVTNKFKYQRQLSSRLVVVSWDTLYILILGRKTYNSKRMPNGPKAFFNQTNLKHVQTTRYLG